MKSTVTLMILRGRDEGEAAAGGSSGEWEASGVKVAGDRAWARRQACGEQKFCLGEMGRWNQYINQRRPLKFYLTKKRYRAIYSNRHRNEKKTILGDCLVKGG